MPCKKYNVRNNLHTKQLNTIKATSKDNLLHFSSILHQILSDAQAVESMLVLNLYVCTHNNHSLKCMASCLTHGRTILLVTNQPGHEKTALLHMRKQGRRSDAQFSLHR